MPGHVSTRATGQHHLMSSRLTHSHGERRTDVTAPMIIKAQSEPELVVLFETKSNSGWAGADAIITHCDSIKREWERGIVCTQAESWTNLLETDAGDTVTEWWAEGHIKVHTQIFRSEDTDGVLTVLAGAWRIDHRLWMKPNNQTTTAYLHQSPDSDKLELEHIPVNTVP